MNDREMRETINMALTKVYNQYPMVEWDDLESQAWLIVAERIDKYDKTKGASLSTYIYYIVQRYLQMYVQRVVLKELTLNGRRNSQEADSETRDIAPRMEAKLTIEKILEESDGVSRDVISLMLKGHTQSEVCRMLGISRQRVSIILMNIRDQYDNTI